MCRGIAGSGFFLSYPAVFFHPETFNLPVYGPPKRWILPEKLVLLEPSDAVLYRAGLLGGNPDGCILQKLSCQLSRHPHSEKVCAGKKVPGPLPTKNGVVSGAKRACYEVVVDGVGENAIGPVEDGGQPGILDRQRAVGVGATEAAPTPRPDRVGGIRVDRSQGNGGRLGNDGRPALPCSPAAVSR